MNLFEQSTHSIKTKTGKVLAHLQEYGSIDTWKAIKLYRATRLSAIIFNLRKEGYNIESERIESDWEMVKTNAVNYIYKGKD